MGQNDWFQKWDFVIVAMLLFTAIVTPYEVAFLSTSFDGLFIMNRVVDLSFIIVRSTTHSHMLQQGGGVGCPCARSACVPARASVGVPAASRSPALSCFPSGSTWWLF